MAKRHLSTQPSTSRLLNKGQAHRPHNAPEHDGMGNRFARLRRPTWECPFNDPEEPADASGTEEEAEDGDSGLEAEHGPAGVGKACHLQRNVHAAAVQQGYHLAGL